MDEKEVFQVLKLKFNCGIDGLSCKQISENIVSIERDLELAAKREHCFHMWNLVDYGTELIDNHFKYMFISCGSSWPAIELINKYIYNDIQPEVSWIMFNKKDYFIVFV